MPRNRSEQAPKRPTAMTEESFIATLNDLKEGQQFRVWFHDPERYAKVTFGHLNESFRWGIGGVTLFNNEQEAMLKGQSVEYTVIRRDGEDILFNENKDTINAFHFELFHAVEAL